MIPDPAPPFEVGMSEGLREHIRRLSEAAARGFASSFRKTVEGILEALRQDPRGSGDPLRDATRAVK